MSKVVRLHQFGGPEQLRIEDLEVGDPGPGEARVRIEAIGLNRSEMGFRQGAYGAPPELPARMGYEAAGVLEALGPGVTGFEPGQRVSILPNFRMGQYGVYAEVALVPAHSLVAAPEGLSSAEAASVWMQFFTALAIIEVGHAGPGDFVAIPGSQGPWHSGINFRADTQQVDAKFCYHRSGSLAAGHDKLPDSVFDKMLGNRGEKSFT